MNTPNPEFDLVIYGATGFVGQLVADHLAHQAPAELRVGLAGRSTQRLERVRGELPVQAAHWGVIRADSGDPESLANLAGSTRAVISTVGPYLRHGVPLVEACARAGTDYVDLTGEVLFVREIMEKYHELARANGARIVVSAGFDSVPSDLAVHLLHRQAERDGAGGLTTTTLHVRRLRGGISGGTVDSLRGQLDQVRQDRSLSRIVTDPEALSGGVPGADHQRDVWRPFVEADTGTWVAPFVMAAYNTRVVRRSNALLGRAYGQSFRYREVIPTGRGARGRARAMGIATAFGALTAGMATPGVRPLLDRALPEPGSGPSPQQRASGSFEMQTSTVTESGACYTATVAAQGDPGYAATSVMVGQAGLALTDTDADSETGAAAEGGILTPAVAMGEALTERLRAQGFTLEVQRDRAAVRA